MISVERIKEELGFLKLMLTILGATFVTLTGFIWKNLFGVENITMVLPCIMDSGLFCMIILIIVKINNLIKKL